MKNVPSPQMFMSKPPPQLKSCRAMTTATTTYTMAINMPILFNLIANSLAQLFTESSFESEIRAMQGAVVELNYQLTTRSCPNRIGFPNIGVLIRTGIVAEAAVTSGHSLFQFNC